MEQKLSIKKLEGASFASGRLVEEFVHHLGEIKERPGLSDDELHRLAEEMIDQIVLTLDKKLELSLPAAASLVEDPKGPALHRMCTLRRHTYVEP